MLYTVEEPDNDLEERSCDASEDKGKSIVTSIEGAPVCMRRRI